MPPLNDACVLGVPGGLLGRANYSWCLRRAMRVLRVYVPEGMMSLILCLCEGIAKNMWQVVSRIHLLG